MRLQPWILAALTFVFVSYHVVQADEFEEVFVRFEQNATDEDLEFVVEATGGDEGMAAIRVMAPDGRTIIDFKSPNSKLGMRHFSFESPEPRNDGSVQADFPEGEYVFIGTTVSGVQLRDKAILSHAMPDTASFVRPGENAEDVPTKGLEIVWSLVKRIDAYVVSIEQEDSGFEIAFNLPANVTKLSIPDGLLLPGTEYKLAIGTVSQAGNSSFVETELTTAEN